jgi:hypothetical protein
MILIRKVPCRAVTNKPLADVHTASRPQTATERCRAVQLYGTIRAAEPLRNYFMEQYEAFYRGGFVSDSVSLLQCPQRS